MAMDHNDFFITFVKNCPLECCSNASLFILHNGLTVNDKAEGQT